MWSDPLTVFGSLSIPLLVSNFLTLLGFILAAFFALKYTQLFYEGRPKPKSWILIVAGLLAISISEIGQFLMPYRINPLIIEAIFTLITHSTGIILIVAGCYLLYKEIP
ncbi:MAG: hypothetical protein ACE5J3_07400 [Methanosarcinales archaeon]